jgi:DNA-binding transcriptional ArsR family regulator
MGEETLNRAVEVFQLLAHPVRLQILDELRRAPACVCHLQMALRRPQAYISQQLRVLREAGAVAATREGLNIFYHLRDPQIERLLEEMIGPVRAAEALPLCSCPRCHPSAHSAAGETRC